MSEADWNGHTPRLQNFQIQEVDGRPLEGHNYDNRDSAIKAAQKLSEDYQIPLIVQQTI